MIQKEHEIEKEKTQAQMLQEENMRLRNALKESQILESKISLNRNRRYEEETTRHNQPAQSLNIKQS